MGCEPRVHDVPMQENDRMILPTTLRRKMGIENSDRQVIADRVGAESLTAIHRSRNWEQKIAAIHAWADAFEGAVDGCLALVASMHTSAVTADGKWTGILARLNNQIEQVR